MVTDISNSIKTRNWSIGDKINIDFKNKDYEGKSVRRDIIDSIVSRCMGLPVEHLFKCITDMRFFLEGNCRPLFNLKLAKDIVKRKRITLPKIIDEKRRWIRNISELINNFEYAVITGIEVCPHQLSDLCPANISYMKGEHHLLRYKVMIVGKMNPSAVCEPSSNIMDGGSSGKMNVVAIKVDLLDTCFLPYNVQS